jgi:hypothetical protein
MIQINGATTARSRPRFSDRLINSLKRALASTTGHLVRGPFKGSYGPEVLVPASAHDFDERRVDRGPLQEGLLMICDDKTEAALL